MSRAVLVLIDGVRPDALSETYCPTLERLRREGSWTYKASSVMPTVTLPCLMSIFHGVLPARHGVMSNNWAGMVRPVPGLIEVAAGAGLRCGAFYNWEPLRNLSLPNSLAVSYFWNAGDKDLGGDQRILDEAIRQIEREGPDFAFVYFGSVDIAGHKFGWMSQEYLNQLAHVDGLLGDLLSHLGGEETVLVLSDHGGHERGHGSGAPEDMVVPWFMVGPRIRRGWEIEREVSLIDAAPTLAKAMGIAPHVEWEGRVVEEVFV